MWAQLLSAALGIWLMAAPAVLGYDGPPQINDRIIGPVVTSIGVIAAWGATRGVRWLNLGPAIWLLMAPWILGYAPLTPTINSTLVGAGLLPLALVRGQVKHRFGGGWASLLRRPESNRDPHPSESR